MRNWVYSKAAKRRVKPYHELSRLDSEAPIPGGAVPSLDNEDRNLNAELPKFTVEVLKPDGKLRKSDAEHRDLDARLSKLNNAVPNSDDEVREFNGKLPKFDVGLRSLGVPVTAGPGRQPRQEIRPK